MHHLMSLNISYCKVEPKAIEYLLPTEHNALGGCSELADLDLCCVQDIHAGLLKKIILALPNMRNLKHELLINALGQLTEEEMGVDTARYLNSLFAHYIEETSDNSFSTIRYDLLVRSPVIHRLKNITSVNIQTPVPAGIHTESSLLADVLRSLPKLRGLILTNVSEADKHVLPLLESIGDRLVYLRLFYISGNLTIINSLLQTIVHIHI